MKTLVKTIWLFSFSILYTGVLLSAFGQEKKAVCPDDPATINLYKLQDSKHFRFRIDQLKIIKSNTANAFIPIAKICKSANNESDSVGTWIIYKCSLKNDSVSPASVEYRDITDYKILDDTTLIVYGNISTNAGKDTFTNIINLDETLNNKGTTEIIRNFSFNSLHFDAKGFIVVVDNIKTALYIADHQKKYKVELGGNINPDTVSFSQLYEHKANIFAAIGSPGLYNIYKLDANNIFSKKDATTYKHRILLSKKSTLLYNDDKGIAFLDNNRLIENDTVKGKPYFFAGENSAVLFTDTGSNSIGIFDITNSNYKEINMSNNSELFRNCRLISLHTYLYKDSIFYFLRNDYKTGRLSLNYFQVIKGKIETAEIKKYDLAIRYLKNYSKAFEINQYRSMIILKNSKDDKLVLLTINNSGGKPNVSEIRKDILETLPYTENDPLFFCKINSGWIAFDNNMEGYTITDSKKNVDYMNKVVFLPDFLQKKDTISFYYKDIKGMLKYVSIKKKGEANTNNNMRPKKAYTKKK